MTYSCAERIAAGPDVVWRHLTVPELMDKWIESVDRLRTLDGAPLGQRSILLFDARGRERKSEVTDFEEQRSFTLRAVQGSVSASYRYRIEPSDNGTVARLEVECSAGGLWKLFAPLIRRLMWRTDGSQMKALKRVVEAQKCPPRNDVAG